jgi:hypothetical protein
MAAQFRGLGSRSKRAPQLLSRAAPRAGSVSGRKPNRSPEREMRSGSDLRANRARRFSLDARKLSVGPSNGVMRRTPKWSRP